MVGFTTNSLDRRGVKRNQNNYENRIKNATTSKSSRVTSVENRNKILEFIKSKKEKLEIDPNISEITDINDRNREILARLHDNISLQEFTNMGLDVSKEPNNRENLSIVSETLSELGIEKVGKISWFKNEIATAKIEALKGCFKADESIMAPECVSNKLREPHTDPNEKVVNYCNPSTFGKKGNEQNGVQVFRETHSSNENPSIKEQQSVPIIKSSEIENIDDHEPMEATHQSQIGLELTRKKSEIISEGMADVNNVTKLSIIASNAELIGNSAYVVIPESSLLNPTGEECNISNKPKNNLSIYEDDNGDYEEFRQISSNLRQQRNQLKLVIEEISKVKSEDTGDKRILPKLEYRRHEIESEIEYWHKEQSDYLIAPAKQDVDPKYNELVYDRENIEYVNKDIDEDMNAFLINELELAQANYNSSLKQLEIAKLKKIGLYKKEIKDTRIKNKKDLEEYLEYFDDYVSSLPNDLSSILLRQK